MEAHGVVAAPPAPETTPRRALLLFVLLLAGVATHLPGLSNPPRVVWDEIYFMRYSAGYLTGDGEYNDHPPLGKLFIAGALSLAGARPGGFDFALEAPFPPGFPYVAARTPPALAGAFLPALAFLVLLALAVPTRFAFLGGMLLLLDSGLLVESRLALIDVFVPFFALLTVLTFVLHLGSTPFGRAWWCWLLASAVAAGLLMSSKWTGAGTLVACAIVSLVEAVGKRRLGPLLARGLVFVIVPAAVYLGVFVLHFRLLPPVDASQPQGYWGRLAARHSLMVGDVKAPEWREHHTAGSRWWSWPFLGRLICYRGRNVNPEQFIAFLGNPAVWGFGTLSLMLGALLLCRRRLPDGTRGLGFLAALHLCNWVPFGLVRRDMFVYHYLSAMVASVLFGVVLLSRLRGGEKAIHPLLGTAAAGFILMAPLVYGWPLWPWWTVSVPVLVTLGVAAILWPRVRGRRESGR